MQFHPGALFNGVRADHPSCRVFLTDNGISTCSELQEPIKIIFASSSPRMNSLVKFYTSHYVAHNVDRSDVCQQIIDICVVVQGRGRRELCRAGGNREAFTQFWKKERHQYRLRVVLQGLLCSPRVELTRSDSRCSSRACATSWTFAGSDASVRGRPLP